MYYDKSLHNRKYLKKYRQQLRKNLTPAEVQLWKQLRNKQLAGRKFRRQHSIGHYIVDFYCPSEKLIIELEGKVHHNVIQQAYDQERKADLEDWGFTVLVFDNTAVFLNIDSVLATIRAYCNRK